MTERRRRPRTVLRVRDTARCDDDNLGGAALLTSECDLRGWHITDDPAKLVDAIESGHIVKEEKSYQELGPGLYISAVPHVWTGRSTKKWAFLSKLTKSERRELALALVETIVEDRQQRRISQSEAERGVRDAERYVDDPEQYIVYLASAPYGYPFWRRDYLEGIGLAQHSRTPVMVEIRATGRFVELGRNLAGKEWRSLSRRFDGAYQKTSMGTTAQTVIWNPAAITFVGDPESIT